MEISDNWQRANRAARRILRNPHDAEDAVQDTFLYLTDRQKFNDYIEPGYIISVAQSKAKNILKKSRKFISLPEQIESTDKADSKESRDLFYRIVTQLPDTMRNCLLLLSQGKSYGEIAYLLDIPKGTVMSSIYRGKDKVRQLAKLAKT